MSSGSSNLVSGQSDQPISPEDYILENFIITTSDGNERDIRKLIGGIYINESLYNSEITLTAGIVDGVNFLEKEKIAGNERIDLLISRGDNKFNLPFFITGITDLSRNTPGVQYYRIEAAPLHSWNNQLKTLTRSFNGSIGGLIKDIIKDDLKAIRINEIDTETGGNIKGIYPNIRPLKAISWLLRNANIN